MLNDNSVINIAVPEEAEIINIALAAVMTLTVLLNAVMMILTPVNMGKRGNVKAARQRDGRREKQRAEHGAQQHRLRAGQRNVCGQQSVRAEQESRGRELQAGSGIVHGSFAFLPRGERFPAQNTVFSIAPGERSVNRIFECTALVPEEKA